MFQLIISSLLSPYCVMLCNIVLNQKLLSKYKCSTSSIAMAIIIFCALIIPGTIWCQKVIVCFYIQTVDIQSRNYPAGLERCKAMADSCNFSEISPFMPGMKLLLQLGVQLDL